MMKRFYRIAVVSLAVVAVGVIVLVASAELTSRPGFCSTCHYMRPYVDAWETSTHADVTCTDCHFPPGFKSKVKGKFTALSMLVNYATGVYKKSKPWAEISDGSCLRSGCHSERLLEGEVEFREAIVFDHEPHLTSLRREKKLRCTSCHSQIVQGKHISVTESTCFLCHFKNQPEEAAIDNCTWCHAAPVSTAKHQVKYDHSLVQARQIDCQKCHGKMQVGDGAVPRERCSACHAEKGKLKQYEDMDFIHRNHVTDHKIECQNCHLVIQHKSVSRTAEIMPECQSCHLQSHQAQLDLFSGSGGKNIQPHPNPMFDEGLNCQACHIFHEYEDGFQELGETMVAKAESCEGCHGEGYARLLEQWQHIMDEKMNMVAQAFVVVEEELVHSDVGPETQLKTRSLVEDARFNLEMVQQGNVVHNVAFSDELLDATYRNLKQVLATVESDVSIPDLSVMSRLVPSECKNCHYGQEEVEVEVFDIPFSHNTHVVAQEIQCSQCHSNMQKHGELIIMQDECLSCHHRQEEAECAKCHSLQAGIYDGTTEFAAEIMPDLMYEEGVECLSCHGGTDKPIQKVTEESCFDCHDSDYEGLLTEWQSTTEESLSEIADALKHVKVDNLTTSQQAKIERVRSGIIGIEKDGSQGVHNIALVERLLDEFSEIVEALPQEEFLQLEDEESDE